MRVTQNQLIELATASTQRAEQQVATASTAASTGLSVTVPSDNVTAWVTAARDRVRAALDTGGGAAIQSGLDQLQQTDGALETIATAVSSAKDLAIEGVSGELNASDRQNLATQVTALFQTALSAANSQNSDGSYLLAGSASTTQPYDANGNYQGNAAGNQIGTVSGSESVAISGDVLTAANGVDVLPALAQLAQALNTNNLSGVETSIGDLSTAVTQINDARAQGGAAQDALNTASTASTQLEQQLTTSAANLTQADAVGAASQLAQATQALQITQAVSSRVIAALAPAAS